MLNIHDLVVVVCNYFQLSEDLIYSGLNKRPYSSARQLIWKIIKLKQKDNISYKSIGQLFNNRSHATILQGIISITNQLETDRLLNTQYKEILFRLNVLEKSIDIKGQLIALLEESDIDRLKYKIQLFINTLV